MTVSMEDYGNFEKTGPLGFDLPRSDEPIDTSPGDVILYLGNKIVICYDSNRWELTRIGRIEGMDRASMLEFFGGKGPAAVTFSVRGEK